MATGWRLEKAELSGGGHENLRATQVAWVPRGEQTESLYRRMEELVLELNARYFRFDLSGLAMFQYACMAARKAGISTGTRIMAAIPPIPSRSRAS